MHNIFYAHIFYGIKVIINRMYYPSIIDNNTALLQQLRFTGIPSVVMNHNPPYDLFSIGSFLCPVCVCRLLRYLVMKRYYNGSWWNATSIVHCHYDLCDLFSLKLCWWASRQQCTYLRIMNMFPWFNMNKIIFANLLAIYLQSKFQREKTKWSNSIPWQKPLYQQKCQNGKVTTQKHHEKVWFHSDCRPT